MSLGGVWLLGFASTESQANDDLEKKTTLCGRYFVSREIYTGVFVVFSHDVMAAFY